jgi:hypothetical protein
MRRGWTNRYRYMNEKRQRQILIDAGVEERVIYGPDEWEPFVRSLRPGDEAVVADLRIFGSRRALGEVNTEIERREAVLVSAARGVRVDPPTLRETQLVESQWAGERSMGSPHRARELGRRGNEERRRLAEASRLSTELAEKIWRDTASYPVSGQALSEMPGWSRMKAYRAFGAREPN